MTFSSFFINRPIFAGVLSIIIFMVGAISIFQLPVAEYPEVSPPSVGISASFPGANPAVVAETVATPLEEQLNGVENMLYMNSIASTDGNLSLTITFKIGTDVDLAQQQVQNRVAQALPRLPDAVRQIGVTVTKSTPDLTMVVHMTSPNKRYDMLYLRNYANLNVKDQLAKINGVGSVRVFGSGEYAMRIWLNPDKIAERSMNAGDVIDAIRGQNIQIAAGTIGGPPYDKAVQLQLPIRAQGRLGSPDEFEQIIVKRDENGVITRLGDVARIEVDSQNYGLRSLLDNKPAIGMGIFAEPDANALQISADVRKTMAELKKTFPEDVDFDIIYDPTVFVSDSIEAVIHTLLEAVGLVVLVVIIFLQTWRASIIPLLAVPVSIVGTFAFMYMFGFSINVLSLFGLILAIGIVVDDAIVVVENAERNIENGKEPHEAARIAMREVTGPILATALVLTSVFVPIAFISGLTGQFYKQFALTIAIATIISTINSLTLSPALCATILRSHNSPKDTLTKVIDGLFGWFFKIFNAFFNGAREVYAGIVGWVLHHRKILMVLYVGMIGVTVWSFQLVPSGYVPPQDKAYLIAFAQLPSGSTLDMTEEVIKKMSEIGMQEPGVANSVAFPGLNPVNGFVASSSAGVVFLPLKPFEERNSHDLTAGAIAGKIQQKFAAIPDAFIAIFPPPPVRGMGTIGGFKLQIEDRADLGDEALDAALKAVTGAAWQNPALTGVFSSFNINVPQLYADLDRSKALQLGLSVSDVFETMQVYLGSYYINDFNQFGRTYQVIAQGDKEYRSKPEDILKLQVRNDKGQMVPLGSVMTVKESFGPETASRYNAYRSADLNGNAAPGFSSGEGQAAITKILEDTLPQGMAFEWTDLTYQQILAGNTTMLIFPLCILLVLLVLAAQYESFALPIAVILIVPMSILSAIIGVYLSGGDNNIFTQISLFVLAGLACKNAILIIEFARELEHQGMSTIDAAKEASRLRLRPILMTSFAFIMGVLPLVFSHGAGSEMRHAIGIAVFSGMLGVTFFGLVLTPVFYVILRKIAMKLSKKPLKGHDDFGGGHITPNH